MQYALMELPDGMRLIDACEADAGERYHDRIVDVPLPDDDSMPLAICYGAYLVQDGVSEARGFVDMLGAAGCLLGHVAEQLCLPIVLADIRAFGSQRLNAVARLPFAALIQADASVLQKIQGGEGQAISAFLRTPGISPVENLLSRRGVFALQELEPSPATPITANNWGSFLSREKATRVARRVR